MPSPLRGLYAIIDTDFLASRGIDPLDFAERVLAARPALLQLRAKLLGARDALALSRALQARCRPLAVPLFVNDRPDLAILAEASGVHLGQSELSLADVRRLAPELAVGVSTHALDEVDRALEERPAYVAFGPVFTTASKRNPEPVVGLALLAEAARRCRRVDVPLVAIGGIDESRALGVGEIADLGAVISGLLPAAGLEQVTQAAARLHG
ncbi:MAG TPA: thiamine phosphate synthase, partial [Polyangiaceae bacterium]|nr:thiamine phosphate synthase [Polyangiaceae bacterium]